MQQNNNNGPKRPVLVDKNHSKKSAPGKRQAPAGKQTVGQRQAMHHASDQALSMANSRGPSLAERAEKHRRELHEQERAAQHPHEQRQAPQSRLQQPQKKKKQQARKKEPGFVDKIFVRANVVPGVSAPDYLVMEIVAVLLAIGLIMVLFCFELSLSAGKWQRLQLFYPSVRSGSDRHHRGLFRDDAEPVDLSQFGADPSDPGLCTSGLHPGSPGKNPSAQRVG